MKTRELTNCLLFRRLSGAAAALVIALGAAQTASAQATNYPATILSNNPVAYYQLQELPGATTAIDSSINHMDAAYDYDASDATPVLGFAGIDTNSIAFLGNLSDGYGDIDIPFNNLLSPTTSDGMTGAPFSIECWAQAYSGNVGTGIYLSVMGVFGVYGSGTYYNASGWLLGQTPGPGSTWLFNMKNAGFLGSGPVVPLQWTHLVGTFDGTNQNFYVNAQLVGTAIGTGYLADNDSDGMIGAVPNAGFPPYGPWLGGVDQVAFYTNALTSEQISNDYAAGINSLSVRPMAPLIATQPVSETNFSGTEVTFSVVGVGTPPLYYQWTRQGVGPIPNATNASYSLVSHYPDDNNAVYFVEVSNSISEVESDLATNVVQTGIEVEGPPFSITRNIGSHAAFRIAVVGAVPLGYQWSESTDGGATFQTLLNQTADTLWLTNVQMNLSGNEYAVLVTNPFTSYSNFATLTVQPRATNETLSGYAAIVAADNPVAFWQLNEPNGSTNAIDAVGSFDGGYSNALGTIVFGITTGVPNDTNFGVDLQDSETTNIGLGGQVDIPYALELNPFGPWSAEAWIRPDGVDDVFRVPFSSLSDTNYENNETGWNIYQTPTPPPAYWALNLFNGGNTAGYTGNDLGHPLVPGTWYHLVITDDGNVIQLYVNGVPGSASTTVAASGFIPNGLNGDTNVAGEEEVLGQGSDGAYNGGNNGMADVAFYNYALTPAQIQLHYLNRASLTVSQANGQTIVTWPVGVLLGTSDLTQPFVPVAGAASPYTVPPGSPQFFYKVVVH
ncbi:MAG TPA: LamG domain-containing protein [Candidatus Baltobacteraceae bacterium]|jgi:hypothetical protein|nr:LamG domain-containing protein [Candidatus Baltobacteraceae bacterium]